MSKSRVFAMLLCALMLSAPLALGEVLLLPATEPAETDVQTEVLPEAPEAAGAMVSGVAVDRNGFAAANTELRFIAADGTEAARVQTDAKGHWSAIQLAEGTYTVQASGLSFPAGTGISVYAGHDVVCRVSAQRGDSRLSVNVYHDKNKNGEMNTNDPMLSGALVELLYVDNGQEQVYASAVSAGDTLTFSELIAGTWRLRVTMPERYGFSKRTSRNSYADRNIMNISTDQEQTSIDITLTGTNHFECGVAATFLSGAEGMVWLDANGNGIQDQDEPGLAGAKVELKGNRNGLSYSLTTDDTGAFRFTQLKPGSYSLIVTLPNGYVFTRKAAGGSIFTDEGLNTARTSRDLTDPQMWSDLKIGALPAGSMQVQCFVDSNYNGVKDSDESMLSGMKVELLHMDNTVVKALTSDKSGVVTFTGLRNDSYKIRCTLPDGSYDFTRVVEGGNRMADNGKDPSVLAGVQVGIGESYSLVVGAVKPGSITGTVFYDTNFNGVKDQKEYGTKNVTVTLQDETGATISTATTNGNGAYTISTYPGRYRLVFTARTGYAFLLSDTLINANDGLGYTDYLDMGPSAKKTGVNAALIKPCTVTTRVWSDENDNGRYDAGEGGLTDATLTLRSRTGNEYTIHPPKGGRCVFDAVAPGDYQLIVQLPENEVFLADVPDTYTLSADRRTATSGFITVSNDKKANNSKVNIPAIGGTSYTPVNGVFFIDTNANGTMDAGEIGLSGATLSLTSDKASVGTLSVTTGEDGVFDLGSLRPGDYTLTLELPSGWMISRTPNVTMPIKPETFTLTREVHLGVRVDWSSQQLGVVLPCTLSGLMWMDEDNNGVMAATEPGPGGRELTVIDLRTGKPYVTLTTAEDGTFCKNTMLPGEYRLVYTMDGYCSPVYGADMDFTAYGTDSLSYENIVLTGADEVTGLKLGLISTTSVGGLIWQDVNGEILPLPGRTVRLMNAEGIVLATTVSGEDGRYAFHGLEAGDYCVDTSVPEDTMMVRYDDWRVTSHHAESVMSYVTGTYGRSDVFHVRMGRHMLKQGTGAVSLGNLGDMCWLDENGNGLQDTGEYGIPNVTIQLLEGDTVIAQTVTDQYGYYRFLDLYPGEYVLHVIYPAQVMPTVYRNDYAGITSVMQETGIDSYPVRVTSGGHNYAADIGFRLIRNGVYPAGYGQLPVQDWK